MRVVGAGSNFVADISVGECDGFACAGLSHYIRSKV